MLLVSTGARAGRNHGREREAQGTITKALRMHVSVIAAPLALLALGVSERPPVDKPVGLVEGFVFWGVQLDVTLLSTGTMGEGRSRASMNPSLLIWTWRPCCAITMHAALGHGGHLPAFHARSVAPSAFRRASMSPPALTPNVSTEPSRKATNALWVSLTFEPS